MTTDFLVRQTATDLIALLNRSKGLGLPQVEVGNDTTNALMKIADALKRTVPIPQLTTKKIINGIKKSPPSFGIGCSQLQRVKKKPVQENTWKSICERIRQIKNDN